jgi:hypothetical protein
LIISDYLPIILRKMIDYIIDYRRVQNRLLFPSLILSKKLNPEK